MKEYVGIYIKTETKKIKYHFHINDIHLPHAQNNYNKHGFCSLCVLFCVQCLVMFILIFWIQLCVPSSGMSMCS